MNIVRDTRFCVTNWSAIKREQWPNMVACAKHVGPTTWSWPKRVTPLSIKCLLNSAETYELPGRTVTVNNDSYLIINEGTEYSSYIDSVADVETATVFIAPTTVADVFASLRYPNHKQLDEEVPLPSVHFVERLYPRNDQLISILTAIHKRTNSSAEDIEIQQLLYALIEHLASVHDGVNGEIDALKFTKASTREEVYRRLYIARDYMLSDLSQKQNLEQIATLAGFAPHHFLRLFKEVFATTPHQYLLSMRLEKAKALLHHSKLSVNEICADTGFASLSSFSSLYKKKFQVSPLKDRKQGRAQKKVMPFEESLDK
ncbi:MAG: AraC family transcriptional regulator [Candidatus Obscuribacterales bacterium]|nr:AraC family transcriptional regulator [Candidatus Obscuribacterales bacterium]